MKKLLLLTALTSLTLYSATFNVSTTPELRTALTTAASNGVDDTIILACGTYKTTDDGGGTFIYLSNEANKLTIQGSSSENVILSGDHQHQILNINKLDTADSTLILKNLIFINGNAHASGGAIYANNKLLILENTQFLDNHTSDDYAGAVMIYPGDLEVYSSSFIGNSSKGSGGAIRVRGNAIIKNSKFIQNHTSEYTGGNCGGGAIINSDGGLIYISDTNLTENYSACDGGAIYGKIEANNIQVVDNNSSGSGGGIHGEGKIFNSIISGNSCKGACYGGGISFIGDIYNSIVTNNSSEIVDGYEDRDSGGMYCDSGIIANNIIANNSSGAGSQNSKFINNIFIHNENFDIKAMYNGVIQANHNYLDEANILGVSSVSNNIFTEVNLGFIDEANGDYDLTASSDLIGAGITTIEGLTLPTTDMNGYARIVGGSIDIGPYEFSITRPTINSISYTGTAKELSPLTFSVDYTLASGRAINTIEYDYANNGSWSTASTHTFNTAGTYTVNAKITDNEGEFSTISKVVTIEALAFTDMTDEQKLIKAIDPVYYDAIIAIIDTEKSASHASGVTTGENNVILDPHLFGLKIVVPLKTSDIDVLPTGWSMLSIPSEITDMSIFTNLKSVWYYSNGTWRAYSSNSTTTSALSLAKIDTITTLPANSAVWVEK